jgi:hypothetical protein
LDGVVDGFDPWGDAPGGVPTNSRYGPSPFLTGIRLSLEAVLHCESVAVAEAIALTP